LGKWHGSYLRVGGRKVYIWPEYIFWPKPTPEERELINKIREELSNNTIGSLRAYFYTSFVRELLYITNPHRRRASNPFWINRVSQEVETEIRRWSKKGYDRDILVKLAETIMEFRGISLSKQ